MSGKTFTPKFRSVKDLKEEKLIKCKDEIDKYHILLSNKMPTILFWPQKVSSCYLNFLLL